MCKVDILKVIFNMHSKAFQDNLNEKSINLISDIHLLFFFEKLANMHDLVRLIQKGKTSLQITMNISAYHNVVASRRRRKKDQEK